jgi:superfamily II DNA or RNA helicase
VSASTVILVPTTSLLYQWYALLTNVFQTEIGVYYSSEKRVLHVIQNTPFRLFVLYCSLERNI